MDRESNPLLATHANCRCLLVSVVHGFSLLCLFQMPFLFLSKLIHKKTDTATGYQTSKKKKIPLSFDLLHVITNPRVIKTVVPYFGQMTEQPFSSCCTVVIHRLTVSTAVHDASCATITSNRDTLYYLAPFATVDDNSE